MLETNNRQETQSSLDLTVLTSFKGLMFLHAIVFLSRMIAKKKLTCTQTAVNTTLAGMVVQVVQKVWDALARACNLGP